MNVAHWTLTITAWLMALILAVMMVGAAANIVQLEERQQMMAEILLELLEKQTKGGWL